MGYILNEEQTNLVDMVKEFMTNEIKPHVAEFDITGEFPRKLYEKAFEMGLHCLEIPEEFGGGGVDYLTAAAIYEEMAKIDAGFSTGLCAISLALKPVLIAGTPEQKKLFSDIVVPGAFGAFCLTEPNAGSDAGSVRTTAVKDGDEYIINGGKCFITNGGVADVYVVFASTDKSKGVKGLTAFIVERSRSGITVGKEENKMGIRLSNTAEVVFEDVRIPALNLLGKEGEGFKIAMKTLDLSRPFIGAIAVGVAQRAIDEAVKYSKQRVQFGKPISQFQAIQFILADMDIETEAARQTVVHAIQLILAKKPHSRESAIAKCFAGDVAVKVTSDAIQVLGGYGYSRDYPVEKLLRDSKIFQIFEGTNQIQRVVVAGHLLK
ncbi:acyl-CoA dehydrogenase family protein [Clostridium sp.]